MERGKKLNQIIRSGGAVHAEIGMLKAQSPSDWLKHAYISQNFFSTIGQILSRVRAVSSHVYAN
jgi:hypothetical protein